MKYRRYLDESWAKLLHDNHNGKFLPKSEADIQCYLYGLLLREIRKDGGNAEKIHAEWNYEKRKRIDLMMGKSGKGMAIEIKRSSFRNTKKIKMSEKWKSDVNKLSKQLSRDKPSFMLFIYEKDESGFWRAVDAEHLSRSTWMQRLEDLSEHAPKNVKIYSNLSIVSSRTCSLTYPSLLDFS